MLDIKSLDDLTRKLAGAVPPGIKGLHDDMQTQFRDILQAGLNKLDMVTRDEFDVQVAVLERTRAKLTELEARLSSFYEEE